MGFSELIVIMMIALVVVGPKDLPKVARWLGKIVRRSRSLIREICSEFQVDGLGQEITRLESEVDLKGSARDIEEGLRQIDQAAKNREG